ncbi:hypothetical protein LPJ73_004145, partial [Coemansia sp. RSA 2703]
TAVTPGEFSKLLSNYSKLVVIYSRKSAEPADTMDKLKDLALRVPSYQFAHIDLDSCPVFAQLTYFSTDYGVAAFHDHEHTKGFDGSDNDFFKNIADLDKSKLKEMCKF